MTILRSARHRFAFVACSLTAALLLAGCGGGSTSSAGLPGQGDQGTKFNPRHRDFAQVRTLLARRAHDVLHHHEQAFMATVDDRSSRLVAQQRTLFENMSQLPISSLRYVMDPTVELVPAAVADGDPAFHPQVYEHLQIADTMQHPVSNPLEETFVERGGRWLLGAETTPGDDESFDSPQERPWFGVPLAVRRTGPLTVLIDASQARRLTSLTTAVRDDIRHDASLLGVAPQYAVLVDASTNGVSHAMNSLSGEDAAAITQGLYYAPDGDDSSSRLAGTAIKMNPQTVQSVLARPATLRHELTHFLLRRYSGSSPRWLVEGVAAWVEYHPDDFATLQVPPSLYAKLMRSDRELPVGGLFYDYPDINYPIGQAAVAWLVAHYGVSQLLDLMKAYRSHYQGVDIDPLTPRLLRQVYGISEKQVVDGAFGLLATFRH